MFGIIRQKDIVITFCTAFVLLVYEVFLSRFFSAVLDHNFVFLAISLATLGTGLGGYIAYRSAGRVYQLRFIWLGSFAVVLLLTVSLMYTVPFRGIWFYAVTAFLPFCVGGTILAAIIQAQRQHIHAVYFSDMIGAGLGAISSIWLMNVMDPVRTIYWLGAAVLLISFFWMNTLRLPLKISCILVILIAAYTFIEPFSKDIFFRAFTTSPNHIFKNNKDVKPVFSEWNSLAKTDVYDAGDGQLLYITIDGGAVSPISKYNGNLKEVDYLTHTTSYLAFQDIPKEHALIIGAGGGQEVLTAQMAGFKKIDAVDINDDSFKAVHKMSTFSGDVFQQQGVSAIVSDGRSFIRQTKNQYNIIYLSLVKKKSENGLGVALTENYLFTQEAIREYIQKLEHGGRLAFLLHDENELLKVENAAEKVLQGQGVPMNQINDHMAVIGTYQHLGHVVWGMNKTVITRPLLIISPEPFTLSTAQHLKSEAESIQQIPIHVPLIADHMNEMKGSLKQKNVDLSANQDDKPFFYQKTREVPKSLIMLISIIFIISVYFIRKNRLSYGSFAYVSGLGIGFMVIETTLVQRFILPLGHPTYAFVLVLSILLIAGGIGSIVAPRWFSNRSKRYTPLLWVAVLTIVINLFITWYDQQMFYVPILYRLIGGALILIPLGFFGGMPLPLGLSLLPYQQIGLSWAINGLMTVVGSLLSVLISLNWGITAALGIGSLIYGLLYLLQPRLHLHSR
ncbi:spermine synthase [Paenibacillus sp. MMO-177]|uniref:spermine synthase n=1 Tax=Paenibacillus sp. MMO-177 TaxID=3081289 RepID=UPI00301B44D1